MIRYAVIVRDDEFGMGEDLVYIDAANENDLQAKAAAMGYCVLDWYDVNE